MKFLRDTLQKIKNVPSALLFGGSLLILSIITLWSICVGAAGMSLAELFESKYILLYIRIPRVLAGIFAGMGFAGAGVIIQTLLGNALAGPNIIGVNSGAGFMTIVGMVIFPLIPQAQPVFSFLGALCSVLLVYFLGKKAGASKMTLLLTGVVLNSLFNAGAEILCTFFPNITMGYNDFRVGGLSAVQTNVLYPAIVLIFISVLLVYIKGDTLEMLSLGDEAAFTLGIPVKKYRLFFLISAAVMVGAAVSFAGLIGFLGLIVPHAARMFVGEESKKLFGLSVLWGSILMLSCDTIARTAFAPFELPVGVVMSVIGAPVFIRILLRKRTR